MRISKTATAIHQVLSNEAFDDLSGGLGGGAAQDIESRIANSLFGDDDVAEADDDAALDDERLQDELPEDDDAEADDDAEVEKEEGQDEDQTLASVLGLDDDKLAYDEEGNVVFNAIIDGETKPVAINDLVKSYQLEGHVNNKSIALENDKREFEQTRDKAYGELTNRLNGAENLLKLAEEALTSEFQSIDWNGLRYSDPAEWAAQRQLFSERLQKIEQAKQVVDQEKNGLTDEQKQQQQQQQAQFIQQEVNKMIADNPSWSDQSVMAKEVGELGSFLSTQYGFTAEEIANAMDSRLMRLIQDAHKLHNGQQAVKDKKIPKNVPTFRKPGANRAQQEAAAKARRVKAQKANIRKTGGSVDAIAQSLIDRM